ncbi:YbaN family protein [Gallaecimonas kandeliae]|uniref:YbaN family protein n=1 Tax=Gallaecimonas kandeliae TaxID=3029055 RepID=UPI002647866D|nr:YbaN family protein [Gallaecimonas kandeliae]WKE64440.1 YbaN family protein [Gallaecimonas kandeliae]
MVLRFVYLAAGWLAIALGILGIALPLLPTTPFILLAAWCFAKGSPRCHRWLRQNRWFGQMVRDWENSRGLRRRYRNRAVAMMLVTFSLSMWLVPRLGLKLMLLAIMVAVLGYLYRLPVVEEDSP